MAPRRTSPARAWPTRWRRFPRPRRRCGADRARGAARAAKRLSHRRPIYCRYESSRHARDGSRGRGEPLMLRVGIVGWRGMVGSVLVQRMREERDFDHIEPVFFSTSQAGGKGPAIGKSTDTVKDANDVAELKKLPVIISCQGGEYTSEIYPKLR